MPIVDPEQIISIHTAHGVMIYQFPPQDQVDVTWSRQLRDVSRCDMDLAPAFDDFDTLPKIIPMLHWASVWDSHGRDLYWTGPVLKATATRNGLSLNARDHSLFLTKTRNPINKRWDAQDPCVPAGELWTSMLSQQNVNATPIVRPDPYGDRFDFQVKADEQMLDQTIGDLVNQQGLRYNVTAGVPIIGPVSKKPIASLGLNHFLGDDIALVRDGTAAFNDVLVRGPDNLARARVAMGGLNLQTIVNVDNMFGVSNVELAAYRYALYTSQIRESLVMNGLAQLHPDAPVSIDQLVPSARFIIDAFGVRQLMELEQLEVKLANGGVTVSVDFESVTDLLPELLMLKGGTNSIDQANIPASGQNT